MNVNYKETIFMVLLFIVIDTVLDESGVSEWIEDTTRKGLQKVLNGNEA